MKESAFWNSLRKSWKGKGLFQRVENTTSSGVPDLFCCVQGKSFWIELKSHGKNGNIKLKGYQKAWRDNLIKHGGTHFTITRDLKGIHVETKGEIKYIDGNEKHKNNKLLELILEEIN